MDKHLLSNVSQFQNRNPNINYNPYQNNNNNMYLTNGNNCNTVFNQFYVLNNNTNDCINSGYGNSNYFHNMNNYVPNNNIYHGFDMRFCNYNNANQYINNNINLNNSFGPESECKNEMIVPTRKFNSSSNVYKDIKKGKRTSLDNQKKSQSLNSSFNHGNKKNKKKSSLFQNETNKQENDLRDFQRFCDGLKCELPEYICGQIGSRIMQKYLNKFPPEILTLLIIKIGNGFNKIMIDIYGNYFCKKLFQICSKEQRILVLEQIKNNFVNISKNSCGTHVIQTMLETISSPTEEIIILTSIRDHELELAFDTNATHVLQKLLVVLEENKREQINFVLFNEEKIKQMCLDSKGICVIKKMIKTAKKDKYKIALIKSIYDNCIQISESPYGNYAIQYLFEEWGLTQSMKIVKQCIENADVLSVQKFSSNIIDKLMNIISKERRDDLFNDLRLSLFNPKIIRNVYSNKYGKFILIKVANYMTQEEKEKFKGELNGGKYEEDLLAIYWDIIKKYDGNYINSCTSIKDN